jgi:polygalacturonase
MQAMSDQQVAALEQDHASMAGQGNKAIALRECIGVELSGFTIDRGGHFAILATGCEHLAIRDLTIDTQRDGIDLDCVRRCVVERCRVNSPNDDAIVIKTSLALGRIMPSEDIAVRGCTVSGYDPGTMLDGTLGRTQIHAPDLDRVTGGSRSVPKPMATSAGSPSRIAASCAAGAWPSRASTARWSRTSPPAA